MVCTSNLGLTHCIPNPHDPGAVRTAMHVLNRVVDLLGEFKLGGRPLMNEAGVIIRGPDQEIIRVPWVLPAPDRDLPGLWVDDESWAPPGIIVAWSGYTNNIPATWTLCDGTNDTPDLRGHFIRGAPSEDPGDTGGYDDHGAGANDHDNHAAPDTHTDALNLVHDPPDAHASHTHDKSTEGKAFDVIDGVNAADSMPNTVTDAPGGDTMTVDALEVILPGNTGSESASLTHTGMDNHTDSLNLPHTFDGSHASTDNRPVYMALCWIMKLASSHQTFPNTPFS